MARLENVSEKVQETSILPVLLGTKTSKKALNQKEKSQVALFEKGLSNELSNADTIETTVDKIVKMALVCEFGASLVTKPGAAKMISTISRGIMGSSELRRSALIIAEKFAGTKEKAVKIRSAGKATLNG
jgi:hypothetical protein